MKSKTVASILRHVASKVPSLDADANTNGAAAAIAEPSEKENKKARRAARKAAAEGGDEMLDEIPASTGNEEEKLEMLYETIAWPLGKTYGHPYDAFKLALTYVHLFTFVLSSRLRHVTGNPIQSSQHSKHQFPLPSNQFL